MTVAIRPAGPADRDRIAELHAASWRVTYRGIVDDALLEGDLVANRRAALDRFLATPQAVAWVARGADGIIAFATCGPCPDPAFDLELANLHVDPARKGQGVGGALLRHVLAEARTAGKRSLRLWLFEGNHAALAFYQRHGGAIVGAGVETGLGATPIPELAVGWRW